MFNFFPKKIWNSNFFDKKYAFPHTREEHEIARFCFKKSRKYTNLWGKIWFFLVNFRQNFKVKFQKFHFSTKKTLEIRLIRSNLGTKKWPKNPLEIEISRTKRGGVGWFSLITRLDVSGHRSKFTFFFGQKRCHSRIFQKIFSKWRVFTIFRFSERSDVPRLNLKISIKLTKKDNLWLFCGDI